MKSIGGRRDQLTICYFGLGGAGHSPSASQQQILSSSNPPLTIGAAVQAIIRTILQSGTEMVRIKLANLAENQRQKVG